MKKMLRADALIQKWMKGTKFKKAYDALESEYALAGALIEARAKSGLSQAQLAKRMKTTQPAIARMEGGRQLPSAATLLKFAKATGTKLKIQFVEI
ncbi:MAG: helix-turn-helix transcriptional regulator [Alphaproteobacteria bacterium]